ncbi:MULTISPECIES: YihY/virulence factor BrkB family protein [Olivibacter]|jgi:membrane protein|uniref:Ribonuclease BN n=3 Tax=Sphingobacteriaceae TaxID=84566 RepID=F4C3B9_SPHS2|nr:MULTISPECIES: YihY/virulence factor BrkB family protein [Olivibacter]MDM8177025.1 YihY/virulence factor BrkB family protein [Olivibacter sp. 47]QEL00114.1 YihY/virulence factor BrkB family protein [Olivibacter sp. LS-1]
MKVLRKQFYKDAFTLLKATVIGFGDDKVSKMSAALSYYTIFALAPLLIIILAVVSFVLGDDAQQGRIFQQINEYVGADAAALIQSLIKGLSVGKGSIIATIIGVGTLIYASTKVFVEMQDSLNMIFNVKPKPKRGWVKLLVDRALSFSIVLILGFLLVVSLLLNVVISVISTTLIKYLPDFQVFGLDLFDETTNIALYLANTLITFIVLSVLFGCIFKFLPDVKIKWKDVRSGAFFTAILFMIGKWAIGLYMQHAAPASGYGAAGSIVIILLWINYTSSILFFGAEFTEKNAEMFGDGIKPSSIAVRINQQEITGNSFKH